MPNTSTVNTPKVGMQQDKHEFNLEKGEYSFLLNGTIENFDGSGIPQIQNEASNLLYTNFPTGYLVNGRRYIQELGRTIFFLVNPNTNTSEIGEVIDCTYDDPTDNNTILEGCTDCINTKEIVENTPLEQTIQTPICSYRTIQNDDCLNFNINNPIDIEYRIHQGSLYIYFTDNLNDRRYLYLDKDSSNHLVIQDKFKIVTGYNDTNCYVPIYSTHIDCNKISYNPKYSKPCVEITDVTFGGNLKAGTYQVLACYADSLSNPLTKYFQATNPISIKEKNTTVLTDYITDKALSISINNLDTSDIYTHYNLVIVETVNSFTTFKQVATLPITQNKYHYTGAGNGYKDLTANDIFFEQPIYKTAKSITKANDYLFFSRLKESAKLNLQQAVSKMKVFWQTKSVDEGVYSSEIGSNLYRTFMRDEVYPLGIVFELYGDNDTIAFPLVGPSKSYFETAYGINVDAIPSTNDIITEPSCDSVLLNKKWQIYNTAQIVASPHQNSTFCDDSNYWEYGDFSYWESTEVYPNIPEIWGDLCGKPIRHFKFPDSKVTHIHDGLNGSNDYHKSNKLFPIGIKIDHNSVIASLDWAVTQGLITSAQRATIKAYRIVRGNRVGNKSIVAKGLLYDMWNYNKYGNTYYYPNYPYNDLRQDKYIAPDGSTYDGSNTSSPHPTTFSRTDRYTFHSPDTHFTNYSLGNILKLETEEYGKAEGFFNHCEDHPKYRLLSTVTRSLCFATGWAAAISSITKECRTIVSNKTYISALGVSAGTLEITDTLGLTGTRLKYNNPLAPYPVILPESISSNDCKGTTYQWLSPIHVAALAGENPEMSGLMAGILILAGGVSNALYFLSTAINEINIFTDVIKKLVPKKNPFIQYNSVGKYNNYKIVPELGNKVRLLDRAAYLTPDNQAIEEASDTIKINNWNRESSVFLKTVGTTLPSTAVADTSRTLMTDAGLGYGDLNTKIYTDISSYYGSIKNYVPNQYGSIYNIEYLETNNCSVLLSSTPLDSKTYFGGDTFITRFALKRKHPFFLQTRYKQMDESDVQFSLLGNAGYPNFYLDYGEGIMEKLASVSIGDIFSNPGAFFQDLVGTDDSRMDAKTAKFFYQNGYVPLYSYGIPYFLVESDVNVDLRHGENNREKDYYPNNQDLNTWLQEKYVPITEDNYFFYNKSYSKQNKESYINTLKPDYLKYTDIKNTTYDQRLIYTEQTYNLNEHDNWLINKANNFFDMDATNGKVISVEGIEQGKVLVRSENSTQIFAAYDLIKTDSGTLQTGTGGIFEGRPKEFAITDLGYMGSQHRDMLKTEFGHVFVDAKRGNIFELGLNGSGIDEISRNGLRNWFKENLPLQIDKHIKNIPIDALDNTYKDLGIALSYDKRYNRFFLTKLDYLPLQNCLEYDSTINKFYCPSTQTITIPEHTEYSCTTGYTYNPTTHTCSKTEYIDSIITGTTTYNTTRTPYEVYGNAGTAIYSTWNSDGTGTYIMIPNTNTFWIRQTIGGWSGLTAAQKQTADLENGPVNRLALWGVTLDGLGNPYNNYTNGTTVDLPPINTWIGFETCITIPTTKTYYIALAADNRFRLTIDGNIVLSSDGLAMSANHGVTIDGTITFNKLHIYPITLSAGSHKIKVEGYNDGKKACFAAEIYDNSAYEIANSTSYNNLNIIFTTRNQTSFSIIDYGCPPTYNPSEVVICGSGPQCSKVITIPATATVIPEYTETTIIKNYKELSDPLYFKNISWTASYNLLTKSWVSFHSFTPNFYVDKITHNESGINNGTCSVWAHNLTNKSHQVYYGKLYPFTVEIGSGASTATSVFNSIDYICDVVRYHNRYDSFLNKNITFNKAIVYTDSQNSGQLLLVPKKENDFSSFGEYPNVTNNGIEIEVSNTQNVWNFNTFYDTVYSKNNNIPIWLRDKNNVDKTLNLNAFNYYKNDYDHSRIRGRMCKVRLTNDIYSNYKFVFFINQFNSNLSIR